MILETKRLILRPWEEADAAECFRYAKDPRVGPICGWKPHADVGESVRVIREILTAPETYAIVWKETGLPIGSTGLHFGTDLAEGENEAELGYWLGVPYWGRGIMPEAVREMLRHAFEDLRLERVWCGYFDGNERSKRVQEKIGFRYQRTSENVPVPQLGETRRGHVNLLTRDEWLTIRRGSAGEGTQVVSCRKADVSQIGPLWELQKAYKAEIGEGAPGEPERMRLEKAIETGKILFFGAWHDGAMIGCCSVTVGFSTFDYAPCGTFEDFYILPEYRHKGVARKLVRFAYRESGVSSLTVGCADCDKERYRSLGFGISLGNLLALGEP